MKQILEETYIDIINLKTAFSAATKTGACLAKANEKEKALNPTENLTCIPNSG